MTHRVQLPDEYDEIFHDIEPFWGIDPYELANTQQELEMRDGVLTVQKTDGYPRFDVVRSNLPKDVPHLPARIDKILALVRDIEHELPPMRITFSPYDNPDMVSDWQIKSMALEAAANGTSTSPRDNLNEFVTLLQHLCTPICLESQNLAGSKHVHPARLPVFIRPLTHRHPYRPSRHRLPRPLLHRIGTRWIPACTPRCSLHTVSSSNTGRDLARNTRSYRVFRSVQRYSITTFVRPCRTGGTLNPIRTRKTTRVEHSKETCRGTAR